ncbi:hypothetical protein ASF32_12935 [Methylobacterium sp. Leaf91]|nr:hypothetical protein ASF32_12935 [Methylobacterium sp. Leaf91]
MQQFSLELFPQQSSDRHDMPSLLICYGKLMAQIINLSSRYIPLSDPERVRHSVRLVQEMKAEIARSRALLSETKEILRKMPDLRPNFD